MLAEKNGVKVGLKALNIVGSIEGSTVDDEVSNSETVGVWVGDA